MSSRTSFTAEAAAEIKAVALRFSKALETSSGVRIRGRTLYDAFVKPLGYDSFNQVLHNLVSAMRQGEIEECFDIIRRQIRKHLPEPIDGSLVDAAFSAARTRGGVMVNVDCTNASVEVAEQLTSSIFFKTFVAAVVKQGRHEKVSYHFHDSSPLVGAGQICIFIDYAFWLEETDPAVSWAPLNSFIQMSFENRIQIVRRKLHNRFEKIETIHTDGRMRWNIDSEISARKPQHFFFAASDYANINVSDAFCEAIKANSNAVLVFSPTSVPKSFSRINPLEGITGMEVATHIKAIFEDLSSDLTPNQINAFRLLIDVFAFVIDDYQKANSEPLNFRVVAEWLGNIQGVLNSPWLSSASHTTLETAYSLTVAADVVALLSQIGIRLAPPPPQNSDT